MNMRLSVAIASTLCFLLAFADVCEAKDVTFLASGTIAGGSPITLWYTFDSTTALGANGEYQNPLTAVSYSLNGGAPVSIGPISNSNMFVVSDVSDFEGTVDFYNGYQVGAVSTSGYSLQVYISAFTTNSVLIMPSNLITALPNVDLLNQTAILPGEGGVYLALSLPDGSYVGGGLASYSMACKVSASGEPCPGPPTVVPNIVGTQGMNADNFTGWYVSPVTLSWTVSGDPTPARSGCGTAKIKQTTGSTHTCTATNSLGSATDSVTIKEDAVPPTVKTVSPKNGATYKLNSLVTASFSCEDKLSGILSCIGSDDFTTVPGYPTTCTAPAPGPCDIITANGMALDTTTPGTHLFTVTATDNAGNQSLPSLETYTVQ